MRMQPELLKKLLVGSCAGGTLFGAFLVTGASQAASAAQAPQTKKLTFEKDVMPVVDKYCGGCHAGKDASAGLDLSKYKSQGAALRQISIWEKAAKNVATSHMPPKGMPQPTKKERDAILEWVKSALAGQCGVVDPGRVTIRRLNREEYNNTIRDLTGLDLRPADDFPSDDVGYGFDNIGDVLSISPLLMEKYLSTAEMVANRAIVRSGVQTRRIEATEMSDGPGHGQLENNRTFHSVGTSFKDINVPISGSYRLRLIAGGDQAGGEPCRARITINGKELTIFDVSAPRAKLANYEIPVSLDSGKVRLGVSFLNDFYDPKAKPPDRNLVVAALELVGPLNGAPMLPESHLRIIPQKPNPANPAADARKYIAAFAEKAFRRPVPAEDMDRLMKLWTLGFRAGGTFEDGMRVAVQACLVSPRFLFRVEVDPQANSLKVRNLDDFEIASRLSYFLWSSIPDSTLLDLARQGKLKDRATLKAQARRMLLDPRSKALSDNFASQWLQLRKLAIVDPDPKMFPGITPELKKDMETETKSFFLSVLRNNRPISDFLDGNYSFVNERLATHYGIDGVKGPEFQRVALPAARGGILSQASVLLVTSNPTRTSPTKRGKWVLENILGTPPPPPPPGVGDLKDEKHQITAATLRQLMEQHRKDPTCASCHQRMDPIGFGLENFDPVGKWRSKQGEVTIDSTGVLPDGRKFEGPKQLRNILLADKDQFAMALTEKLLTYGLGRGLTVADHCVVEAIAKNAKSQGYAMQSLIESVIVSEPFLKKRGEVGAK